MADQNQWHELGENEVEATPDTTSNQQDQYPDEQYQESQDQSAHYQAGQVENQDAQYQEAHELDAQYPGDQHQENRYEVVYPEGQHQYVGEGEQGAAVYPQNNDTTAYSEDVPQALHNVTDVPPDDLQPQGEAEEYPTHEEKPESRPESSRYSEKPNSAAETPGNYENQGLRPESATYPEETTEQPVTLDDAERPESSKYSEKPTSTAEAPAYDENQGVRPESATYPEETAEQAENFGDDEKQELEPEAAPCPEETTEQAENFGDDEKQELEPEPATYPEETTEQAETPGRDERPDSTKYSDKPTSRAETPGQAEEQNAGCARDVYASEVNQSKPQNEEEEDDFPPHTQQVDHLFKPRRTPYRQPSRWDPVEYDLREDSDDEFEVATAMRPVYEEEELSEAPVFKNGEPDYQGEYLSCFDDPNLLYRIYNPEEKTWAFYNDTCNYEMHVRFVFGKHSKLEPLENTTMHTKSTGEHVAEVIVYPGETEMFVKGTTNGFTSKLRAIPLSDEYFQRRQELAEEAIQQEIEQIKGLVGDETNAEEVLKVCVENNIPFVDLEFPPCQASLEKGGKKQFKHLPWARPSSYLPDDMIDQVRLFRSPIRPADVEQGGLGDTWLLCSIAAVSENPKDIVNMFRHPTDPELGKKERSVGGYRVVFNKNGIWYSVLVDNYLPLGGGKPKYARSSHDIAEIWPSIMQKAFAKLHGSYANISTGDPLHALQDLTGRPSCRFDEAFADAARSGKDDLFQDWVKYANVRYKMMLSTPGKDPKDPNSNDPKLAKRYNGVGLTTGHAYAVLDAKYFPEYELRLVKIRSAWGQDSDWNGDWCNDDEKWEQYPEVAEGCNFQKGEEGTFWMTWEACLHYFNGGGVSFAHSSLNDYRVASKFVNCTPSSVLEICVEQPTWMCFTLSQQDKRGRPDAGNYQPVMLSVAEPTDNELYKVVRNSSADASRPLCDKWTFYQARDISLLYKFLPESSPALVIPRLMMMDGQPEEVSYTLGVSCNRAIGQDGVTVQFKQLDCDNKVFHNFPKFEPESTPVEVVYQAKMANKSFPETRQGSGVY
ncbi:calpain-like cysteine peptidase [Trypanosoma grayi]|uniref:calpain-like cysteine peptidase n=1 Tax=Trypanosoma grayi TaxID=71804 RepID=UPI0004F44756|nr:calpain-like cysteine peptidase [Trypanosoma grayi]KEG10836.1 calpain-like cysteine peptidase [Trypanosoma grayi]